MKLKNILKEYENVAPKTSMHVYDDSISTEIEGPDNTIGGKIRNTIAKFVGLASKKGIGLFIPKGHKCNKIFVHVCIKKNGEEITEAAPKSLWKRFDMLQNLRGDGMDLEDEMRDIAQQLKQTHMDMEQEAAPAGGPKATRYGREIEKLEKDYKKKKTEFKKVMAKIERLEMF